MRNSSLVQGFCAENVTGLKQCTEDAESSKMIGRGAFSLGRSDTEMSRGLIRRENAGISTR